MPFILVKSNQVLLLFVFASFVCDCFWHSCVLGRVEMHKQLWPDWICIIPRVSKALPREGRLMAPDAPGDLAHKLRPEGRLGGGGGGAVWPPLIRYRATYWGPRICHCTSLSHNSTRKKNRFPSLPLWMRLERLQAFRHTAKAEAIYGPHKTSIRDWDPSVLAVKYILQTAKDDMEFREKLVHIC